MEAPSSPTTLRASSPLSDASTHFSHPAAVLKSSSASLGSHTSVSSPSLKKGSRMSSTTAPVSNPGNIVIPSNSTAVQPNRKRKKEEDENQTIVEPDVLSRPKNKKRQIKSNIVKSNEKLQRRKHRNIEVSGDIPAESQPALNAPREDPPRHIPICSQDIAGFACPLCQPMRSNESLHNVLDDHDVKVATPTLRYYLSLTECSYPPGDYHEPDPVPSTQSMSVEINVAGDWVRDTDDISKESNSTSDCLILDGHKFALDGMYLGDGPFYPTWPADGGEWRERHGGLLLSSKGSWVDKHGELLNMTEEDWRTYEPDADHWCLFPSDDTED
ncbi:hypothetical protein MIND_00853400 [Mycena indigotica]|uniref:Uncharacterized protein n=1 Tax=Mycena indigotica TaxID=2126181 RepID=A0A8H6SI17_9AGAR|nr:uncharacterized protein MIND_00853400 [Mycena indigotica]KAF7299051.1 hypothetical protein MIND_00853400 [Mycena indigotica]